MSLDQPRSRHQFNQDDWIEQCEILPWWDVRAEDHLLIFQDPAAALGFLRRFAVDPASAQSLREVLAEVASASMLHRMSDHEVIGQLAWHLANRSLRVAVALGKRPSGGGANSKSAPRPSP